MLGDYSEWGVPTVTRQRLEAQRRQLVVKHVSPLTPKMMRITFTGDLQGFQSPSPDDHIKLFFPLADGTVAGRDYTPRRFDCEAQALTVDFFLHEGGPATDWARSAVPGSQLQIGGPRGTTIVSTTGAWWLLIGDEAAIPSIARRLEESHEDATFITLISITSAAEEIVFKTAASLTSKWVHRDSARGAETLLEGIASLQLPAGPGYIWIAAESGLARSVRTYFVETLGHPEAWIKAASYWTLNGD